MKKNKRKIKNLAIVEDDELFSFHVSWMLSEDSVNLNVNSYSNGTNFINNLKEGSSPEIIFLDYHLHDLNGDEILGHINEFTPNTKVIIISSQDDVKIATN